MDVATVSAAIGVTASHTAFLFSLAGLMCGAFSIHTFLQVFD